MWFIDLTLDTHVNYYRLEVAALVRLMHRNNFILSTKVFVQVTNACHTFGTAHLIWAPATETNLQKLYIGQKKALSIPQQT